MVTSSLNVLGKFINKFYVMSRIYLLLYFNFLVNEAPLASQYLLLSSKKKTPTLKTLVYKDENSFFLRVILEQFQKDKEGNLKFY